MRQPTYKVSFFFCALLLASTNFASAQAAAQGAVAQGSAAQRGTAQGTAALETAAKESSGTGEPANNLPADVRGLRLAQAQDFDGAVQAFQEAIQQHPGDPRAYGLMATVLRAKGELGQSLTTYRNCALRSAQIVGDQPEDKAALMWQARCLMGVAQTLELMTDVPRERRTEAWTAMGEFATAHPDLLDPALPQARLQAHQKVADLEVATAEVRKRVDARAMDQAPGTTNAP